jgi:lysophospholipase L1-like esterase
VLLLRGTALAEESNALNVVFIGDSITAGEGVTGLCADALQAMLPGRKISYSNQGHSGATTLDFLPPKTLYAAQALLDTYRLTTRHPGPVLFSIMLGTNDSANSGPNGSPVSPETYHRNLKAIIDQLLTDFPEAKCVLHHPLWYSPNTHNRSDYEGDSAANRLLSYSPVLEQIVREYQNTKPGQVFLGDHAAYNYFKDHHLTACKAEPGQNGTFYLHPNPAGAQSLAKYWAAALARVVTQTLLEKPDAWLVSDEAKAIASAMLSDQSGYGGWLLDGGVTTGNIRFLAKMARATDDHRYQHAIAESVDYLLIAQETGGAWPSSYPMSSKDESRDLEAAGEIVALLQEVANSDDFGFLAPDRRGAARWAVERANLGDVAPKPSVRIALAGDSTVTDHSGWGFGFKKQLAPHVLCENFARGGQSSKSFRDTGVWQQTLASHPDYVLIQFGHNDMPGKGPNRETDPATTYPENLTKFIQEARQAGAKPILVTSLVRRVFAPDGKLRGELAPWAEAARRVAAEQGIPLVDLFARSQALVEQLGLEGVKPFEPMTLPPPVPELAAQAVAAGTDVDVTAPSAANVPRRDATHLTGPGSIAFGGLVIQELVRVVPETAAFFKKSEEPR